MQSKAQDSATTGGRPAVAAARNTATLRPRQAQALRDFDSLPDSALVRAATVAGLLGVHTVTVWRWASADSGTLPPPRRLGGMTGWNVGEIRRVMAATA